MSIEVDLEQYDRIYLDNNKIRAAVNANLAERDLSKLVVPDCIREEFFTQTRIDEDESDWLDHRNNVSLYSLYRNSWFNLNYYNVASSLFRAVGSDILLKDIDKEFLQKALEVEQNVSQIQSKMGFYKRTISLGASLLGLFPVGYFFSGSEKSDKIDKRTKSFRDSLTLDDILQNANKKKRRWLRKNNGENAKRIIDSLFYEGELGRIRLNPIAGDNYNDTLQFTYAILDSVLNKKNIAIYTMDKDLQKIAQTCEKIFDGCNGRRLGFHYHNHITGEISEPIIIGLPENMKELGKRLSSYESDLQMPSQIKKLYYRADIDKEKPGIFSETILGGVEFGVSVVSALTLASFISKMPMIGEFVDTYKLALAQSPSYPLQIFPMVAASFLASSPFIVYRAAKVSKKKFDNLKTILTQ